MVRKLEVRGLHKRFGTLAAVDGVSLALQAGEFFSLLGPSGCGKSTILGLIAGFLAPDAGEILIDGHLVNAVPVGRRRLGLVLQDYAVFTHLSVNANLSFALEALRIPRRERRQRIARIAEQFELTSLINRRAASLNMSEMQRLALARALIGEPELLLLDEPMSNLDATTRVRLRAELRQLQRAACRTVLYVTHDQAEALSMSDRIAVMREGRLLQVATAQMIYDRPVERFVAEFIGDPPINVIACDVQVDGGQIAIMLPGLPPITMATATVARGRHFVAIRPHQIQLCPTPQADSLPARVRLIENFGAAHVLHCEYAGELLRIEVAPGQSAVDELIHFRFEAGRLQLIDANSDRVVPLFELEAAA